MVPQIGTNLYILGKTVPHFLANWENGSTLEGKRWFYGSFAISSFEPRQPPGWMVGCGSSKLGPSFLVTTPRNFGECENTAWYRDVMTQISIKLHFTHPHAAIIRITAAGDTTLHTVFMLMS